MAFFNTNFTPKTGVRYSYITGLFERLTWISVWSQLKNFAIQKLFKVSVYWYSFSCLSKPGFLYYKNKISLALDNSIPTLVLIGKSSLRKALLTNKSVITSAIPSFLNQQQISVDTYAKNRFCPHPNSIMMQHENRT